MYDHPGYSIRNILIDNRNWEIYKFNHPELDKYIIKEIEKMLDCCNPAKGFFYGYCEHCKKEIIMHIKCNGKVCTRCGRQYVNKWVEKAKKKIFKEAHKLVSLTIPADLRKIFIGRWDLLKILQDSAYESIEVTACKTLRKKVKIGILVGLQTYGQDMKFHPHLHCAVLKKVKYNEKIIDFTFIPSEFLRITWRNILIKNLCRADILYGEKELAYSMLERYPNGFVTNVEDSRNQDAVIKYLARYMRHPAISNSRIESYDRKNITIKIDNRKWNNFRKSFTIDEFITSLIQHISPKNFKIVRWYGLYSRREVRLERKNSHERQETISLFLHGKRKIIKCPDCKNTLINIEFFINKPPDKKKITGKLDYWIDSDSFPYARRALS